MELFNIFLSSGFIPTIALPTRVTANTSTLIDNVYIKNLMYKYKSGVVMSDISDHFPVITSIEMEVTYNKNNWVDVSYRKLDDNTILNIIDDLGEIDWYILNELDLNDAYGKFIECVQNVIDKHAPVINKKIKQKYVKKALG